jgi:hypothetical protein
MGETSQLTLSNAEKRTPDHANHNTRKEEDLLRRNGCRNEGVAASLVHGSMCDRCRQQTFDLSYHVVVGAFRRWLLIRL